MKKLMNTKLFKITYGNLTYKKIGVIIDDFADKIVHLYDEDNNEDILRTLNYTRIRLYSLKAYVCEVKKKSINV